MSKTVKRKRSTKKSLKNTKNRSCKSRKFTACCPHMTPDSNGRYASTATKHILNYNGNKYILMTCCKMCGDAMNNLAKQNPKQFAKLYIHKKDEKGNIHAKNRHTKVVVQKLKLIK